LDKAELIRAAEAEGAAEGAELLAQIAAAPRPSDKSAEDAHMTRLVRQPLALVSYLDARRAFKDERLDAAHIPASVVFGTRWPDGDDTPHQPSAGRTALVTTEWHPPQPAAAAKTRAYAFEPSARDRDAAVDVAMRDVPGWLAYSAATALFGLLGLVLIFIA
jgi:hypothetical protein